MLPDRFARSFRFGLGLAGMFLSTVVLTLALVAIGATFIPGWHGTVVASGSMEPALRRGDAVIYSERAIEETGEGTVVVFDNENGISIIHRVTAVNDDGSLTTRGDANQSADSGKLTADRFDGAGRMVVPWIGLPKIWYAEGRYALVVVSITSLLLAVRSARLTSDPLNDPWIGEAAISPTAVVLVPAKFRPHAAVTETGVVGLVPTPRRERLLDATAPPLPVPAL